jgi:DNA repair protein SbcD/Mre11
MKFLHTADWHLGRPVRGHSREAEHEAMLQQMLDHIDEHRADCLLLAGDIFDTAAPPPEAERLAYRFFTSLHQRGVSAVAIAGNHDHPRRIDAVAPLLKELGVHAIGKPVGPSEGGVVEIHSRDKAETALIAALPWVAERDAIDFATLSLEPGQSNSQYGERIRHGLETLCESFRADTVNILVSHLFVDEAQIGPGGGERPLSISLGIYGVPRQMLPMTPQYIALGHVHKPQAVRPSPPAWYSGSPLQQDFGETRQEKFVNLVQAHPGQHADVTQLPMTAGRPMLDVGTSIHGVHLADLPSYAEQGAEAWLRVFVELDEPLANLPSVVREQLPNAVHVERIQRATETPVSGPTLTKLGPEELFGAFYRSSLGRGQEPTALTAALFHELLQEEMEGTMSTNFTYGATSGSELGQVSQPQGAPTRQPELPAASGAEA